MNRFRKRLTRSLALPMALLALAAASGLSPAQAGQSVLTFDTPAANAAEVQALYGLAPSGSVGSAVVTDGHLVLDGTGGVNGNLVFEAAPGDLRFEFDATIIGTPGNVNLGFTTGHLVFYIHPGYWDHYLIPGLGIDGSLGFTPTADTTTHFSVDIRSDGLVDVVIQNNHLAFITSFTDNGYVAGVSRPGLTIGSVPGHLAVYDNLVITTVPEPGTTALWAMGLLLCLGQRRLRSRRWSKAAAGSLLAAAVLPASAGVLVLHDEAVDGDLSNTGYDTAADQRSFTLAAGLSAVRGEVVNSVAGFAIQRDVDAFQIVVPTGLTVTAVNLTYSLGGTGNAGNSFAMNFWRKDLTQPFSVAEYIAFPRSGSQSLFDAGGPFAPVLGQGAPSLAWLMLNSDPIGNGTRHTYAYDMSFTVEPTASTVPEPGTAGLWLCAGLGLGLWRRRHR